MSPVRHCECTRTSTGSPERTSPITIATWCWPSMRLSNAWMRNGPYDVGRLASAILRTSRSCCIRYWMRSRIVIMRMPCSAQKRSSCGTRAIVPSSFITSQMTPAG